MATPIPFELRNRSAVVSSYDMKQFNPADFSTWLGADGEVVVDGGLVVVSRTFRTTRAVGPHGHLDHYKMGLMYRQPIMFQRKHETKIQALISNQQVFPETNSFPSGYKKRILDKRADPRLCHGFFTIIDPKTGIEAGFWLTDHALYVYYSRDDSLSGCDVKCNSSAACVTCPPDGTGGYTCFNYETDPEYQMFRQNMTEGDFGRFILYVRWVEWCASNNVLDIFDWNLFSKFQAEYPSICASKRSSQELANWMRTGSYAEYCISGNWPRWLAGYKDLYSCGITGNSPAVDCTQDSCSAKMFGRRPGCAVCQTQFPAACMHKYTRGANCYDQAPMDGKNCACFKLAQFSDLHQVLQISPCDPLCTPLNVAIGVDRAESTLNFYVNQERVFQHIGIGRRGLPVDRVCDYGGEDEVLDIQSAMICFGTGTATDFALPANYSRLRVTNEDSIAVSALANTRPATAYRQIYYNSDGVLGPVVPEQTFADSSGLEKSRAWGQGDIFKIYSFSVMTSRPDRSYELERSYRKSECCGYIACNARNASGCLANNCDGPDDINMMDLIDPSVLEVEFSQVPRPLAGDDVGISGAIKRRKGLPCGELAIGEVCVRAKIVKSNTSRPWQSNCDDTTFTAIHL